ncbi:MAG TPA: hypothetical protein VFS06_00795 [Casimicrobiaceae bacterium]|jgi:hypothetical protein|nr:hypothetical protein [Casimicrobiaceae bacterium]
MAHKDKKDKSLDEQIAEVEGRLARHRAELRLIAAEARSRVSVRHTIPIAVVGALAIGFLASRFVRKPAKPQIVIERVPRSRSARMAGALAAALLPRLVRPLQHVAADWLAQRMARAH